MPSIQTSPPATEPVSLAEAKAPDEMRYDYRASALKGQHGPEWWKDSTFATARTIKVAGGRTVGGLHATLSEDLKALLTATALSQRGSIQTDARTNTIIINDLADRLERAASLITSLDVPQPQVEIEARIVQTTRSFANSLGVKWGMAAG